MGQLRKRGGVWWIRYSRNGKRYEESSHSDKKGVVCDLLRRREGAIADGVPVSSKINRFRFDEAASDLITEYKVNGRRSLDELERRIEKHLTPFFGGRRMSSITTADVRTYIAQRQSATEVVKKAYSIKRRDNIVSNGDLRTAAERLHGLTGTKKGQSGTLSAGPESERSQIAK
jgi:hypothetical protein